ncbi:hypothetical protein [Bartonella sp. AA2SXKL]|uniref:hypothetical protein n=1 Tax=Bartonella sp. AA2SXKL TaxID=3243432 RepID=UPI0035D046FF
MKKEVKKRHHCASYELFQVPRVVAIWGWHSYKLNFSSAKVFLSVISEQSSVKDISDVFIYKRQKWVKSKKGKRFYV